MKETSDFDLPDGQSDSQTEGPLVSGRPIRCPLEPTLREREREQERATAIVLVPVLPKGVTSGETDETQNEFH